MNARIALPVALLTFSLLAAGSVAQAGPWSLEPGEYYSHFAGGWSSTDVYHDQFGELHYLPHGGLVEERSLHSYTELGWKKRMSFVLGIPVVSTTRRFGGGSEWGTLPTTTGLADALIGLRYRLANGRSAAALQVDWRPPLSYDPGLRLSHEDSLIAGDASGNGDSLNHNIEKLLNRPTLGDGQNDLTFALHLGTALGSRVFVQASGGYRLRFSDAQDQLATSGALGFWLTRKVMISGRYDGFYTLESGVPESANEPVNNSTTLGLAVQTDRNERWVHHRAGPMLLFRVDDRLDLFVNTMHTISARNALHTDEVYAGVAFRHATLNRLQGFLGTLANP